MIKAVVFDADGVLIRSERFSLQLERDYNISLNTTLPFFQTTFQDCVIGKADLKEELSKVINKWGWGGSVEELLEYWFKSGQETDSELLDHVKKIRQLGIKCLVATNNERYRTDYILNQMGFVQAFDRVYGSGYLRFKKPDFEFYKYILKDQNLTGQEVILWDDDLENVKAAMDFGMNAEVYQSLEHFKELMVKKYQFNFD